MKQSKRNRRVNGSETPSVDDLLFALERVRSVLPVTPLTHSPSFSERIGCEVYLKWDNKLRTGSFKERGAVNFLESLSSDERRAGVCAASAGNHALAVSHHAARLGIPCTIVMPRSAPLVKVEHTRAAGASVLLEGRDFDEAYERAQRIAIEQNSVFVPAFDDARIIAGQATAALEAMDQLRDFDAVVYSVGGGGYISGGALALRARRPETFILGVQSEWAVRGRTHGEKRPAGLVPGTIADGIAVKRVGALTKAIIDSQVDKLVTLSETDIAHGIVAFLRDERTVVEGAGAAALAGVMCGHLPTSVKRVVVFVSGSNIDINVLSRLIDRDMREQGRLVRVRVAVPDRPGSLAAVTGAISDAGANVLETFHDRSFSQEPGNVDITFLLEVRNGDHRDALIAGLRESGFEVTEL